MKLYLSGDAPRWGALSRIPYLGKTLRIEGRSHLPENKNKNTLNEHSRTYKVFGFGSGLPEIVKRIYPVVQEETEQVLC